MGTPPDKTLNVYYDGSCKFCTIAVQKFGTSSMIKNDITKNTLPPEIPFTDAWKEVHVIDGAGNIYRGVDAVFRMLDEHAGWRIVTSIGKLPGFYAISIMLYKIVARLRH